MYVSVPYLDFLKTRRGSITQFGLFEHFFRTIKVSCQSKQGFDTVLGFFEMATLTEDLISKAMRLLLLEMRVLDWFIAEDALPFMAISKMFMFASLSRLLQPFRVGYDANDFSQVTYEKFLRVRKMLTNPNLHRVVRCISFCAFDGHTGVMQTRWFALQEKLARMDGFILLPQGEVSMTGTVKITDPDVRIVGFGGCPTKLRGCLDNDIDALIEVTGENFVLESVDLSFSDNSGLSTGLTFLNSTGFLVKNCGISRCCCHAIQIVGGHGEIRSCRFSENFPYYGCHLRYDEFIGSVILVKDAIVNMYDTNLQDNKMAGILCMDGGKVWLRRSNIRNHELIPGLRPYHLPETAGLAVEGEGSVIIVSETAGSADVLEIDGGRIVRKRKRSD